MKTSELTFAIVQINPQEEEREFGGPLFFKGFERGTFVFSNMEYEALELNAPVAKRQIKAFRSEESPEQYKIQALNVDPEKRREEAIEKAKEKFWESIVESYPEAESGGCEPLIVNQFDKAVEAIVRQWVEWNVELK